MDYTDLQNEIKLALKAQDKDKLSILRQWHCEIKNIEVDERRQITDQDVDAMCKRMIKQTRETLEGSIKAANDPQRTELLSKQVEILESYLPKQLEGEELIALIDKDLAETGATCKKDMGAVMAALNAATGGNLDKRTAAAEVGKRLS